MIVVGSADRAHAGSHSELETVPELLSSGSHCELVVKVWSVALPSASLSNC
jgi:hypothetical protein